MTEPLEIMGRMMLLFGVLMLAIGGFMIFLARLGAGSGLPGDIIVRRPGMVIYIPIASAIIASIVLSLLLSLLGLLRR